MKTVTVIVLFAVSTVAWANDGDPATRPNIVLILADDLGYSDLGCYGGEIRTPNIDALAAGGVRFTQLYNSARCCPSRASLMTGLYPSQAGIGDFTTARPSPTRGPGYLGRLNDQCVTLAEVLKPAGYGCYYVGKWHMHPETGPIRRGFDEFYGYTNDHSHDQYDADYYIRLPEGRKKEIDPPPGEFYATDVFNAYALEFIRQGQQTGQPWFLFLGHSSPHFPVQAPADRADKYEDIYRRGWDVLREERFARMQRLGLIDGEHWRLTPRSIVPVDRDDIANGFSGQQNPAWDSLDEARQRDLARRMAVFAAMVESVDMGVGQIVDHLKSTGDFDNTLILFLSDNGACYEWGPYGFDGPSRRGETILHTGDDLRKIGGPATHHSYGSAWANQGNTPLRLYKHFTHEGGISTPFIAHWPKGIGSNVVFRSAKETHMNAAFAERKATNWIRDPAHVMDIMPTILDATGASYPAMHGGHVITPMEGASLLPVMRGEHLPDRTIGFDHQGAHALRQGDWKLVWSKRMPDEIQWELYDLAEDRCETNDLAAVHPQRVQSMAAEWERWAKRVGVVYERTGGTSDAESPIIANRPLTITGHVRADEGLGVVVAQGGREHGYAVHLVDGKLAFDVRVRGAVTGIISKTAAPREFDFEAKLTPESMTLAVDGKKVAEGPSPGLIPVQPKDSMNIGRDELTAAGDYTPPNPLRGTVENLKVIPGEAHQGAATPTVPPGRTKFGNVTKPLFADPNYNGSCDPEIVDDWRYALRRPLDNWRQAHFDDSGCFPPKALMPVNSNRKAGPVMDAERIRAGLKSHDRALYTKAGWIRDPYIVLGPDDDYYLTGTQPNPGDPREAADPYNIGLGEESIVGEHVRLWRSKDLIEWEYLGEPFKLDDTFHVKSLDKRPRKRLIWAPEVHWLGDRWALVHCPAAVSSLALTSGAKIEGPWTHPMGERLGGRHDPSLFHDDDGTWYLLWGNIMMAPLSEDFSRYTAGKITGPYGPRKFAGRFLGHGTPFQDREGKWWCTAFFNANVPPLPREGIETRDLSENAQTINEQGVTIVPLDVRVLDNGDIHIRAKDPAYATPGPDEVQKSED
jgi:arylsulfatase